MVFVQVFVYVFGQFLVLFVFGQVLGFFFGCEFEIFVFDGIGENVEQVDCCLVGFGGNIGEENCQFLGFG